MLSSRQFALVCVLLFASAAVRSQTGVTWANTGSDFTAGASWVGGTAPANNPTGSIAEFGSATVAFSPVLDSTYSVAGVRFAAGAGAFTFSGHGALTLGAFGISNLATSPQTVSAPLIFAGTSSQITSAGSLSLNGSVTNDTTAGLTVGGTGTTVITGIISGAGALNKTGAGTLILDGFNVHNYSGATNVTAGTLQLRNFTTLGSSEAGTVVSPGATLHLNETAVGAEPLTLGGTGSNAFGIAGALTASGSATFGGPITFASDTTIGVLGGPTGGGLLVLTGPIGESGGARSLTKTGFGALHLGGPATYSGTTIVNQGSLVVGSTGALPAGGNVVINATGAGVATLDLAFSSATQTVGNVTFGGGGAASFARNTLIVPFSDSVTLGGHVTVDPTNNPGAATISSFGGSFGGKLSLGGTTRVFNVGDSANAASDLTVLSDLAGSAGAGITKTGAGALTLGGNSTYSGTTTVSAGTLLLGSSSVGSGGVVSAGPVGTGALVLQAGTTLAPTVNETPSSGGREDDITIGNNVSLASNVTLGASGPNAELALTFSGPVTVTAPATTIHLGGSEPIVFESSLNAPSSTALTFDGGGVAVLAGTTGSNIANVTASGAAVLLGAPAAVPAGTLQASNGGYIGIVASGGAAAPGVATVFSRITDKANFNGTFGFDGALETLVSPPVFADAITLTGFGANFTLGSLSVAKLTGTITPSASGYTFGNGGGLLGVASALTAAAPVSVVSRSAPEGNALAVVFQGNNSFTGNLGVTNSIAVLDSANALPAGRKADLGVNGYLGMTEHFGAGATFAATAAARLNSYTPTSIVGLDSTSYFADVLATGEPGFNSRLFTGPIDLTALGPIYFGTASNLEIGGPVLAPNQGAAARTLSLAAVKGGNLTVYSPLLAGNVSQVVIGTGQAALGGGRVELAGVSTYAGGTTLLGGTLAVSAPTIRSEAAILAGPLGAGPLTIPAHALSPTLRSFGFPEEVALHNAIALHGTLRLGEEEQFFPTAGITATGATSLLDFGSVVLKGAISGGGRLEIFNDAALYGANTFTGGVTLHQGMLVLGSDTALGSGTVRVTSFGGRFDGPAASLHVAGGARTLGNNLVLDLFSDDHLVISGAGRLTLNGAMTLNSNVTFSPTDHALVINGPVGGFGRLGANGDFPVYLNGANTYTGGTHVDFGSIVFASANAIPATSGLLADYSGYIGVASTSFPTSLQANFLNRFDRAQTSGTIGFDSPAGGTNTFGGDVDLSGFQSNPRLGSSSRAILAGTITPAGSTYSFGGGGGFLQIDSALVDSRTGGRSVEVNSPGLSSLTVRLAGANTYTGSGTTATNSAVLFKQGSLPSTGTLHVYGGGYIGTEDATLPTATFLGRFDKSGLSGTIGFDSPTTAPHVVSGPLDLSGFNSSARVALGTATVATLGGAITLPAGQNVYRFNGYKGGQLTVLSALSGASSVEIADSNSPATFGSLLDRFAPLSSVTLGGDNTHSGDTKLFGGALGLGHNHALGGGTLRIEANFHTDEGARSLLFAAGGPRTIANNIVLDENLWIGGAESLTLSGAISGFGEIYKRDSGSLTLAGNNANFSGGIYIGQGNVSFAHANAAGTGPFELGSAAGPSATFLVSATVHDLRANHASDVINLAPGTTLTVNQSDHTEFAGQIRSTGSAALVVQPGGFATAAATTLSSGGFMPTLRLSGSNSYNGTTTVRSGVTVVAANNTAFGPSTNSANTVKLEGGTLLVEHGVTIANPLVLNSGTVGGLGTIQPSATLAIKTGVTLAPGMNGTGTLAFSDRLPSLGNVLSLEAGGTYQWELYNATASAGWDTIAVNGAVSISASAATPFNFKILPATDQSIFGGPANFNPTQAYSWPVLTAAVITGFAANKIFLDTSFVTSFAAGGTFSLSLNGSNTALMLSFTPVPEPSTYVMIAAGVAVIALSLRRRRS